MRPPIIGVCGYARAGKDTVAQLLEPHGYTRVAFADKLKELALVCDPIVGDPIVERLSAVVAAIGWEDAKTYYPEVRPFLQRLGQGVREILDPDAWVDAALADFDYDQQPRIVVPDVRYPNEVKAIRQRGGVVWRVVRPGVGPANAHASESALDPDTYPGATFPTLLNDGTIAQLALGVELLLEAVTTDPAANVAVNQRKV